MTSIVFEEIESALPTPEALSLDIPQTHEQFRFVSQSRSTCEAILSGVDPRLLLVVGPCSIHDPSAFREYAHKFKALAQRVEDRFFLVLRTYFEKPRTTIGWKGLLYDPHLDGSYDLAGGIRLVREILSELTDLEIPVGSEILEMTSFPYFADFLTWGCIGARTVASPPHRQVAATLPFPMGFKNTVEGNTDIPVQGMVSAGSSHVYLGMGADGQMARIYGEGNPSCHVVLRGCEKRPNYFPRDVAAVTEKCQEAGVLDRVLIDCSHDNCFKKHLGQIPVFESVMEQARHNPHVAGAMLESNLFEGCQPLQRDLAYGVSITDPCLDWATTEKLILNAYQKR